MSDENVALMYRWFEEVWNKGRAEAIAEMLAADGLVHGLGETGVDVRGPEGFMPFFEKLRSAFSDFEVTIEETVAEADKVAARWVVRVTHEGDQLGIPATGRQAAVTGMSIIQVRDGRIIEAWNNWDILGLMQQLGAIQTAATLIE
jgi:steroid delta-isomerase-like uncharacterized protein